MHDQRAEYRQIAVYHRLEEAEIARGLLDADGIPAALLDAQVAALGLGPAVGGVRLLVPAWAEARAVALLTPPEGGPPELALATPTPLPGTLQAVSISRPAAPRPAPPAPGPLALRLALWAAVLLAIAILRALR